MRSAVATSAGFIRALLPRVPRRVIDPARVVARGRAGSCHTRAVRVALVVFAFAYASASARADNIQEIVVEENTKTDADTVILISQLDVGDDWNNDMINGVKANLVSSGLF